MSACAPKGRGQHFYSFQVEVELRSERGRRIDLDESHPRLDFPSHLLPPHSAADRITNFVTAQLEWLQGEEGGIGEGLCHHSHLGEVSSVTALGNQGLEASTDRTGLCWQAPAGSHLAAGHYGVAAGPMAYLQLCGDVGVSGTPVEGNSPWVTEALFLIQYAQLLSRLR